MIPQVYQIYRNFMVRFTMTSIGREKNARLVGKVLGMAEEYGEYPCHRVVNHAGRLVPGWPEQRALLEAERVVMKDDRHVDLKKCRWEW